MLNPSGLHLSLWKQGLDTVPDSAWEQTELETLVLADNKLAEISERVGQLRKFACSISDTTNWCGCRRR